MPVFLIVIGVVVVGGVVSYFLLSPDDVRTTVPVEDESAIVEDRPDIEPSTSAEPDEPNDSASSELADQEPQPPTTSTTEAATMFANGTYSESVEYRVPSNHLEPMTITLTIKNDVITDSGVQFDATNLTSEKYQERFTERFTSEVVGQSLDDVSLSRLGGASLTSRAFNKAVEDIRTKARS